MRTALLVALIAATGCSNDKGWLTVIPDKTQVLADTDRATITIIAGGLTDPLCVKLSALTGTLEVAVAAITSSSCSSPHCMYVRLSDREPHEAFVSYRGSATMFGDDMIAASLFGTDVCPPDQETEIAAVASATISTAQADAGIPTSSHD